MTGQEMRKHQSEPEVVAKELNKSKRDFLRLSAVFGLAAVTGFYGVKEAKKC